MIQANQATVGRIFNYRNVPTVLTEGIVGKIFSDSKEYALQDFKPIPLTPDWLEKFGYNWSIYHQAFHKHSDGYETYDLNECYPSGYQFSTFKKGKLIGVPFHYVHQLQSIFSSLNGEDLNFDQLLNK